jgi:hypothetical protein
VKRRFFKMLAGVVLGLVICANSFPGVAAADTPASIHITGQVVDDATGSPITAFVQQGGLVDDKDPQHITWGYTEESTSKNPQARFTADIQWAAGWRARIVADGYLPQPILTSLPSDGSARISGLIIRMKRGRQVSGHVLDHTGAPVKDANVFVIGARSINISGGNAMVPGSYGYEPDKTVVRFPTDAQGSFTVTGIGEDGTQRLAVSCSGVDLWVVPIPAGDTLPDNLEIRLPEPGKLVIHYDIDGGPDSSRLFLQLHTWEISGWRAIDNYYYKTIKQHDELVLYNLPPGDYEVARSKEYRLKDIGGGALLDRRKIKIESGKTVVTDFVRLTGAPITGQVIGLDRQDVANSNPTGVIISVCTNQDSDPLMPRFDQVALIPGNKPMDGKFTTERIPPGKYKVKAEVYIPETDEQKSRTGLPSPTFTGEAIVTVPDQGVPDPARIELAR